MTHSNQCYYYYTYIYLRGNCYVDIVVNKLIKISVVELTQMRYTHLLSKLRTTDKVQVFYELLKLEFFPESGNL